MMRWKSYWLVAGLGIAATAAAQDDDAPDLAFLEYLGSWQESDEEWLVVADEYLPATDDDEEDAASPDTNESAEAKRNDAEREDED